MSRVLNLLGVYLGAEADIAETGHDNTKGFWEHRRFRELNDQVLSRLGGSWDEPPPFEPGWEESPVMTDLVERARGLVDEEFAGIDKWGWKDPRNCLTLPFWQIVLPEMRYVISLRNPIDVSLSLQRRDGFSVDKGIDLWISYTNSVLRHTSGRPRFFTFYEDVVTDGPTELQRAADFVGMSERASDAQVKGAVEEFIEQALRHHNSSVEDVIASDRLAFPAKALYVTERLYVSLCRSGGRDEADIESRLGECLNALSGCSVQARDESTSLRDQLAEQSKSLAERQQANNALREQISNLEDRLAERDRTVMSLRERVAEDDRTAAGLRERVAEDEETATALRALLIQRDEALAERDDTLQALQKRLDAITSTLGWRFLNYYGRIKYRYLLPIYRLLGAHPPDTAQKAKDLDNNKRRASL
jgi:hypothetical protein